MVVGAGGPARTSPWAARSPGRWSGSTGPTPGLLHAVDTGGSPEAMRTGMRVRIRWVDAGDRQGDITDIACFEPADAEGDA